MEFQPLFDYIARFIPLTDQERSLVESKFKIRKFLKGQFVVQNGDTCKYESFVLSGCLKTFYIDNDGHEHIVMFAIEDWWTGDMYSFLTQTPGLYTIDALEDSELFCLEKNALEELYTKIPKFEKFFRHLLQNAFIAGQRRIIESMSLAADQRYCKFIEQFPLMEKRLPLKQIASYLGITPESLSRIRSQYIKTEKSA